MKKSAAWLFLVVMAAGLASAQSVSVTPSVATYSSAGGTVTFNVTITYPSGAIPSFSVKPPGFAWAYVSSSGSNVPTVQPQAGETTDPTDPYSAFGFTYSAPPAGTASFSFEVSYPSGMSGNQSVAVSADYRLNGVRTALTAPAITLSPQTATVSVPVISSASTVTAAVGVAFNFQVAASNSPTSFAATGLPSGLSLSAATGSITGTPTSAGTSSVVLTATNSVGTSVPSTLTLTVNAPPSITTQPQPQTVTAGAPVTFTVVAAGTAPLYYQWKKGTADIAGATGASYTIPATVSADAGSFFVTVTNVAGSVTSGAASLTVSPAAASPYAVTASASTYSTAGGQVTFNVVMNYPSGAVPSFSVKPSGNGWAYVGASGTNVPSVSPGAGETTDPSDPESVFGFTYSAPPSGTASFSFVLSYPPGLSGNQTVSFGGDYRLNGVRSVVPIAALTFSAQAATASPPVITVQPVNVAVNAGAPATLSVTATGTAPLSYQWKKGTTTIANATNSSLVIAVAAVADAGNYTVTVTNLAGSVTSNVASLVVNSPTSVPVISGNGTASGAVGTAFSYQINASPTPSSYAIASGTLPAGVQLNVSSGVISGTPSVGGTFNVTLTATNTVGTSVPFGLVITITSPPVITAQPRSQAFATGGNIVLQVTVAGSGPFTFQWKKGSSSLVDGGRISGATTASLTVSSAQSGDEGVYSVVVSNGTPPEVVSSPATVILVPAGFSSSHAVVGSGYLPGAPVTITNTLNYPGTINTIFWSVLLPSGWAFNSSVDMGSPTVLPAAGDIDVLTWIWATPPASGSTFTYTVTPPSTSSGSKSVSALVEFTVTDTPFQLLATPEPLKVDQISYHSADTNQNFKIDATELSRVIVLYNTRFDTGSGKVRTGAYKLQSGTADGFAPDAARDSAAVVSPGSFHTADTNKNGKIDAAELSRLIVLYNTRFDTGSGKVRTGAYKPAAGVATVDGYLTDTSRSQ